VSTAAAVGIGLRSFYADPRYGGDDPTLHRLVNELSRIPATPLSPTMPPTVPSL
jgi:hypothetical protein